MEPHVYGRANNLPVLLNAADYLLHTRKEPELEREVVIGYHYGPLLQARRLYVCNIG